MFHRISLVAASEGFRFPACNVVKKETPEKMFFCEFCKIFKNIFRFHRTPLYDCSLCLSVCVEFWDVFQNTCFIERLGKTAILCTSCKILTAKYSKKLFREVAIRKRSFTLNPWKLFAKKLIRYEIARCQPAALRKRALSHILFHVFCLHFLRVQQDYFFQRWDHKVWENNFFLEM